MQPLTRLVATRLDDLRHRAVDSAGADGGSVLREVRRIGQELGELEERFDDGLERLAERHADTLMEALDRGTTWPRRIFWFLLGAAAGAAAAYVAERRMAGQDDTPLDG